MRTIANFESFCTRETPPSTALRDLAHKPVAFVVIWVLAYCCRVSHTTTVSGDEKSLASKLLWKGKSWPKVAVSGKAMIFLCFGGKSSVVFSCYLGSLDPIFVVQVSFTRSFCVASTDYQRFWASLKLMTSQVVQIARQLSGRICPLGAQRVKWRGYQTLAKPNLTFQLWYTDNNHSKSKETKQRYVEQG